MKKILLIEDRERRQQIFVENTGFDFEKYSSILDNFTEDKYKLFKTSVIEDKFDFSLYDVIISHKSAYEDDNSIILAKLEQYCKENKKFFILFSGGIDTNYYNNEEFEYLEMHSETFYSENLTLFLENIQNNEINPLILCYGKYWEINVALNILEKLNYAIETCETKMSYKRFLQIPKIEILRNLGVIVDEPVLEGKNITKNELIKFMNSLKQNLTQRIIND